MLAGIRDILIISHAAGHAALRAAARRRQRSGASISATRCSRARRPGAGLHHRRASSSAATRARWSSATTSSTATTCRAAAAQRRRADGRRDGLRLSRCTIPSATASSSSTRSGARCQHRGEAGRSRSRSYAVTGLYFYDNAGASTSPRDLKPSRARRARDHRRQPRYLERGELDVRGDGPRLSPGSTPARTNRCSRPSQFIADDRAAAGPEDRLPGGDRLPHRLHRRRAAASARPQPLAKNGYGQYLLQLARRAGCSDEGHADRDSPDVLIVEPRVFGDERGFFFESFNAARLRAKRPASTPTSCRTTTRARAQRRAARPALPDPAAAGQAGARGRAARSSTSRSTCAAARPRSGAGSA